MSDPRISVAHLYSKADHRFLQRVRSLHNRLQWEHSEEGDKAAEEMETIEREFEEAHRDYLVISAMQPHLELTYRNQLGLVKLALEERVERIVHPFSKYWDAEDWEDPEDDEDSEDDEDES